MQYQILEQAAPGEQWRFVAHGARWQEQAAQEQARANGKAAKLVPCGAAEIGAGALEAWRDGVKAAARGESVKPWAGMAYPYDSKLGRAFRRGHKAGQG